MSDILKPDRSAMVIPVAGSLKTGIDVWVWQNLASSFRTATHTTVLDDIEHRALANFSAPAAARAFAAGRVMARVLLARYAGFAPTDIRFMREPYGKLRATSPAPVATLSFNLSHAADAVVIAIAENEDLGIDIEGPRALDVRAIAQEAFTRRERAALEGQADGVLLHRFLRIWTLKEAFVKTIGVGFSVSPDAVEIDPFMPPREISLVDPNRGISIRLSQYGLQGGLIVALGDAAATHRKVSFHMFDHTNPLTSKSGETEIIPFSCFEYTTAIAEISNNFAVS